MIEQITRRKLISGLAAFIAAPAIVRASSLMPVKAFEQQYLIFRFLPAINNGITTLTVNGVRREFNVTIGGLVLVPCTPGELINDAQFTTFAPQAECGAWL